MVNLYDKLINKVIKSSNISRFKRVEEEVKTKEEEFTRPFITISREPGSGGKTIAKLLEKWLGFELYDKQLLLDLSKSVRKREEILMKVDEKGRDAIEDMVHSMFNPDYVSDIEYIKNLSEIVLSAAIKGEVIILGRGANFITPFDKGFHVRISAPYNVRVERAIKFEKLRREKAVARIRKIDENRKEYISQFFNKDISNANYYDLVINTADMSIKDAAEHVALGLKNKFPEYAKKRYKLFEKLLLSF